MSKHTDPGAARLYLAEHDMRGIQRGSNSMQIPLLARKPQNPSIANDAIPVVALGGQLFDKVVGQGIGKNREAGISGLIVELRNSHDSRLIRAIGESRTNAKNSNYDDQRRS